MDNVDNIQRVIETLVDQLEMVSNKCQMEQNKKVPKISLIEYSTTMLHLSKTISELMLIKKEMQEGKYQDIGGLINGRLV